MLRRFLPRSTTFVICLQALSLCAFASKEHPVIGLSMDSFDSERWQRDRDNIVATVEKLGGKVLVRSADGDDAMQGMDIEAMIKAQVDAIVVVPHNGKALGPQIEACNKAKIPVISYDRLVLGADISYFLGVDNRVGEYQAKYAVDRLPAGRVAKIVRICGSPTDHNALILKEAQDRVLKPSVDAGKVKVIADDWAANWKASEGKRIVSYALEIDPEFDAVIASNDGTASGAIEVLEAKGLAGKVIVTGQDADVAACARIKQGTQSMTVFKPIDKLAGLAANLAVDLAHGKEPTTSQTVDNGKKAVPAILVEVTVVDRTNVETIIAQRTAK